MTRSSEVDTFLVHRTHDLSPAISVHLVVDGERRVFTVPLSWGNAARACAALAKLLAEDLYRK